MNDNQSTCTTEDFDDDQFLNTKLTPIPVRSRYTAVLSYLSGNRVKKTTSTITLPNAPWDV
jgi:hypothetical protein